MCIRHVKPRYIERCSLWFSLTQRTISLLKVHLSMPIISTPPSAMPIVIGCSSSQCHFHILLELYRTSSMQLRILFYCYD